MDEPTAGPERTRRVRRRGDLARRRRLLVAVGGGLAVLLAAGGVVVGVQVREQRAAHAAESRHADAERVAALTAAQDNAVDDARALVAGRLEHLAVLERARVEAEAAEAAHLAEEEAAQRAAEEERAAQERAQADRGDPAAGATGSATQTAHPSTGVAWVGGAGPDCGGPDSWEPPRDDVTPLFTSTPATTGDGSNGRLARSALQALDWCTDSRGNAQWLVPDAAASLTRLNEAFRARFGENLAVDLSYRSYADQVAMREQYGSLAAEPGTSNHGLGTAVDVWEWEAYAFGSERYVWLVEHGPAYGWVAPDWARADGSNPEYWHFEHVG